MPNPIFNSNNKRGETFTLNCSASTTVAIRFERWDKEFSINDNLKSVRIDWGDGSQPESAGNISKQHTYTASTQKTITIECNKLEEMRGIVTANDAIFGELDLTGMKKIVDVQMDDNPITAITFDVDGTTTGDTTDQIDIHGTLIKDIDLTGFKGIGNFIANEVLEFSGLTIPNGLSVVEQFNIRETNLNGINGSNDGHLDFSNMNNVGEVFNMQSEGTLGNGTLPATGVTFPTTNKYMRQVRIGRGDINYSNGQLLGTIDLTPLQNIGGIIDCSGNLGVTDILFYGSNNPIDRLWMNNLGVTNLDLTPLSGFGTSTTANSTFGTDWTSNRCTNLTAITTSAGVNKFAPGTRLEKAYCFNSDFTGEIDFSNVEFVRNHTFSWISERVDFRNNSNLTSVIGLSGETGAIAFDGSGITALTLTNIGKSSGGDDYVECESCSSLSSFTQYAGSGGSGGKHRQYCLTSTQLTDIDLTNQDSGIRGLYIINNSQLTGITFTSSTISPSSLVCGQSRPEISLNDNNLGYVDFRPFSGASYASTVDIRLEDNGMTAGEVNHILSDFDDITSIRYTGGTWTGLTMNISGTNAAPDGSSGGFDGLTALSNLTGSPINWTITTS